MELSTGRVEITPQNGDLFMGGYGCSAEPRTAVGTHAPLYARCVAVWDGSRPYLIVTADVLGFPRPVHQSIRQRVIGLAPGFIPSDFVLTATHTHNAAALPERLDPYIAYAVSDVAQIDKYGQTLVDTIVALVQQTLNGPRKVCTLDYTVAQENFAFNREGLTGVETDVPILAARDEAGALQMVLFSYGCHPVAAGPQSEFDPDYPGAAISVIEANTGAFAMFVLGPAGDQDPITPDGRNRDWDLMTEHGNSLGQTVVAALQTAGGPLAGPIDSSYQEVELPLDAPTTAGEILAFQRAYAHRRANALLPGWYQRHAEKMIEQLAAQSFETAVPLPLQVWKLQGNPMVRFAFTGGELVSGYADHFRAVYGGTSSIWITGYSNEIPCYIASDELLYHPPAGSYDGGWDSDFPNIAGGSMIVYNWVGHFRGKPTPESPDGIEQVLISALDAQLA